MTRDPILNSAMKKHPRGQVRVYDETGKRIAGTSCGGYLSEFEESRKPRTVTTAAELDALPVGSVVLTEEGWPAVKFKTFLAQCWRVSETFRTGDYPSVRLIEHAPTVLHEAATR